jgi:hypothetical protein
MASMTNDSTNSDLGFELVISILAVNQYSLEKTYLLKDSLKSAGLFDFEILMNSSAEELEHFLKEGGCNRGEFMTSLFASRLNSLGEFIKQEGLQNFKAKVSNSELDEVSAYLLKVKGIGPRVIANFFALRDVEMPS